VRLKDRVTIGVTIPYVRYSLLSLIETIPNIWNGTMFGDLE